MSSSQLIACQQPSSLVDTIRTTTTLTLSPTSIEDSVKPQEILAVMSPAASLEQRASRATLSEGMVITQLPEDLQLMAAVLSTIDPAQDTWRWRGHLVEDTTSLHGWMLELELLVAESIADVMVGNLLRARYEDPNQEEGDEFSGTDDGDVHDFEGNLNS